MSRHQNMNLQIQSTADGYREVPLSDEELEALTGQAPHKGITVGDWWPKLDGSPSIEPHDNPFRKDVPVASYSSRLTTKDVQKLYDGMAYAMWRHKVTMNAHIIVVWSAMNIEPQHAAKLLGRYLHEAQKWAAVGLKPNEKRRRMRLGWQLHYLYVHEDVPTRGFHSHVLMNVEKHAVDEFKEWSRQCLARLTRRHVPFGAFRLVKSYGKTKQAQVDQSWLWFRYIMKEYDDTDDYIVADEDGRQSKKPLRQILQLWKVRPALDIPELDRCKVSHSLGAGRQKADGFRSDFWSWKTNRPYQEKFGGWEIENLVRSLQI